MDVSVRQARADDAAAVTAFTRDTWSDRFDDGGDYIPDVFPEWVEADGPNQRTVVAEADGDVAGLCQVVLLSAHEAWAQGMRVNPDFRGGGVARALNEACFDWAREQGATVCRNMVFSWNRAGLGTSRAVGYDPCTEFRWAHVEPDSEISLEGDFTVTDDAAAAWSQFARSDAREHLRGLTLDPAESWALSEATRERFEQAAAETAVFAVKDGDGTRASAFRTREFEREADGDDGTDGSDGGAEDGEDAGDGDASDDGTHTWAEYGVAAWDDVAACRALLGAIARDAAAVGADRTRVLVPETVGYVSDAVHAGAAVSDHPDFVLEADLSAR